MGAGLKERRLESPSSKAPRSRAPSARRRVTVCVGSSMASTKSHDSAVQDRTVSVLPSRYSRVMEASYVRQNLPMSWERKSISIQGMLMRPQAQEGVGQGRRGKAELVVGFSSQSSSVLPGVTRQAHGDAVSFGTGLGGGGGGAGSVRGSPRFPSPDAGDAMAQLPGPRTPARGEHGYGSDTQHGLRAAVPRYAQTWRVGRRHPSMFG